jgi:transcriptional regulator with XRE-family HTH domain
MAKVTGPIGPRRNIALTLKQLREDSGKLLADVAGDLLISTSKLSRLENAQGKPQHRDIRDLIRYYGIEGTPQAEQLWQWVAAADRPVWWADYDEGVVGGLAAHLAYEADATVERAYTLPFVPALLQTADYAEAYFRKMESRSEDEIRQLVDDFRIQRQKVLTSRDGLNALKLVAVTHESTLRQAVGSPKILRDQLDALIERSTAPNVSLHVLPFAAGPVFTMTCMYAYFEYQDDDNLGRDVVHIETHTGFLSIEDSDKVADYRKWHDKLVQSSLNEDASRDLIRSVRDDTPSEQ